jgi:hypothetical protein
MGRQGLPINWEGFEASSTRWHGLQNTIHHYYTLASQVPVWSEAGAGQRRGGGIGLSYWNEANLRRNDLD